MLVGAGSSEGRTAQPPSCISVTQARDEEEGSCSHDSSGLPSNDGGAAECKSRTNGISWCCDGDSIHRIAAQDDMHRLSWRRSYRSSMAISTALCVAASLSNVVDAAFILPSGPFTGAALVFGITVACAVVIEFELVRSYVSQEPLGPVGAIRASMLCNLLASVLGTASGVLPAACRERASLPDILASCDDVQFNLFDSASALTGIAVALLASHGVCLPTFAAIRAVIIFSALLLGLRLALSHGETHVQSIAITIIFTIVAGVCVRLGYDRDLNARCLQHRRNATLRKQLARESEAAQQAAATAYSATIGFMMHDLRTPLQGIASSLYFVQSSREVAAVPRSSAFHSDLKQIGLCVSRITSLCNDVLDLSTVGETAPSSGPGASRGAPIHPTLCSPRDIVRDVINQVSRATPVPIVTHIAGSVPARALTDGSRLRRIILVALASAVRVARSRTTVVVLIYSAPPEELAADDENSVAGAADGERMTARSRELLQPHAAGKGRTPGGSPERGSSPPTAGDSPGDQASRGRGFPSPPWFGSGRRKRKQGRRTSAHTGGRAPGQFAETCRVAKGGAAPLLPEWAMRWQAANPAQGRLWSQPRRMAVQITFLESGTSANAGRYRTQRQGRARAPQRLGDVTHSPVVRTEGQLKLQDDGPAHECTRRGSDPQMRSSDTSTVASCPVSTCAPPHPAPRPSRRRHGPPSTSHSQLTSHSQTYTLEAAGPGMRLQETTTVRSHDSEREHGRDSTYDSAYDSELCCGDDQDSEQGAAPPPADVRVRRRGGSWQQDARSRQWIGNGPVTGEGHHFAVSDAAQEPGVDTAHRRESSPSKAPRRGRDHSSSGSSGEGDYRRRRQWCREVLAAMTSDVSLRLVHSVAASMSGSLSVHRQDQLLRASDRNGRRLVTLGATSRPKPPPHMRGNPTAAGEEVKPAAHGFESPASLHTGADSLASSAADAGTDQGASSSSSIGYSRYQESSHQASGGAGTSRSGKASSRSRQARWRVRFYGMGRSRRVASRERDSLSASHMTMESPIESQVPPNDPLIHKAAERLAASHIRSLRLLRSGPSQPAGLPEDAVETLQQRRATTMLLLVPMVQRGSQGPSSIAARAEARTTSAPLAPLGQGLGPSLAGTSDREVNTEDSGEGSEEEGSQRSPRPAREASGGEGAAASSVHTGTPSSSGAGPSGGGAGDASSASLPLKGQALDSEPLPEEQDVVILREPEPEAPPGGSTGLKGLALHSSPLDKASAVDLGQDATPSDARTTSVCDTEYTVETSVCESDTAVENRHATGSASLTLHHRVRGYADQRRSDAPSQIGAAGVSPRLEGEVPAGDTLRALSSATPPHSASQSTDEVMPALVEAPPPHSRASVLGVSSLTLGSRLNEAGPSIAAGTESAGSGSAATEPPTTQLCQGLGVDLMEPGLSIQPMISGPASLVLSEQRLGPGATHRPLCLPHAASLRVLVTEDERSTRRLLVRMMQRLGVMKITEAADGTELISRVEEAQKEGNPFHVILSDIVMRQMNGRWCISPRPQAPPS